MTAVRLHPAYGSFSLVMLVGMVAMAQDSPPTPAEHRSLPSPASTEQVPKPLPPSGIVAIQSSGERLLAVIEDKLLVATRRWEEQGAIAIDPSLSRVARDRAKANAARWEKLLKGLLEERESVRRDLKLIQRAAPSAVPAKDEKTSTIEPDNTASSPLRSVPPKP